MKKILVSFEIDVECSANNKTEDELKRDVEQMLHVYSRSNAICIENVVFSQKFKRGFVGCVCRGFGCVLSSRCRRFLSWNTNGGFNYIDYCDPETRELYIPDKSEDDDGAV